MVFVCWEKPPPLSHALEVWRLKEIVSAGITVGTYAENEFNFSEQNLWLNVLAFCLGSLPLPIPWLSIRTAVMAFHDSPKLSSWIPFLFFLFTKHLQLSLLHQFRIHGKGLNRDLIADSIICMLHSETDASHLCCLLFPPWAYCLSTCVCQGLC